MYTAYNNNVMYLFWVLEWQRQVNVFKWQRNINIIILKFIYLNSMYVHAYSTLIVFFSGFPLSLTKDDSFPLTLIFSLVEFNIFIMNLVNFFNFSFVSI